MRAPCEVEECDAVVDVIAVRFRVRVELDRDPVLLQAQLVPLLLVELLVVRPPESPELE